MTGFLLDTGIISAIRNSGHSAVAWVGDADLAVPITVVDEVFQAIGNTRLFAQLPAPLPNNEEIIGRAEELRATYAPHQPPLMVIVSLIAACALIHGRILITKDRKGFHFIRGLALIDAVDFRPDSGPLIQARGSVMGGPIANQCCSKI